LRDFRAPQGCACGGRGYFWAEAGVLDIEEIHDPRQWYSTNLVGVSSELLASVDFNDFPQPLSIASARYGNPGLFRLLTETTTQAEAAEVFGYFMEVAFGLAKPKTREADGGAHHRRASYIKLLQGWGFDANSPPGAVLKGWVESRFGIVPTYHKGPLSHFPSEAWLCYLEEKLSSRFHNNCIQLQLDILYEYCQFSLERFRPFDAPRVQLYRGVDRSELTLLRGSVRERRGVIRLNNLVSFSASRERAEAFGEVMLCAEVPQQKVLFFPGLIADRVLNGEGEVLVLGGDFDVRLSYD
jgi:NAD+--dinitrogen-reductase ADP-D-ribosyltransferase